MSGAEPACLTLAPVTTEEAREMVRDAAERRDAIYPVGGGSALEELLPKRRAGIDLSLAGLNRVVEFSPRDLTITVEAGMPLAALADIVDEANLLFPFASKFDQGSTVGGLLATARNGPRRTGWGNLRDYVIGVRAIDGRGVAFRSGGKVVKNVSGYDFCKLLVGSRGTLAILTEATLRLKPRPERVWTAALTSTAGQSLAEVRAELISPAIPYSIFETTAVFVKGSDSFAEDFAVCVGWEGPSEEIEAAKSEVDALVRSGRFRAEASGEGEEFKKLLRVGQDPPFADLAVLVQAPPTTTLRAICAFASGSFAAGNGLVRWSPRIGQARLFYLGALDRAAAVRALDALRQSIGDEGYVTVVRDRVGLAPTRELRFGRTSSPQFLMDRVKATLDPYGIFNPGRYVFEDALAATSGS